MGKISGPHPVKLFIGMLAPVTFLFDQLKDELISHFGTVDLESPVLPWEHSQYYEDEMGPKLKRKFTFFSKLISPGDIADIKIRTNDLEQQYLNEKGGRRINLDPGYLDASKLVLVTTKDYSHRIYLRGGIYGEVTLIYKHGEFRPLPYTYHDYASVEYRELFSKARGIFMNNRNSTNPSQNHI